MATIKSPPPFYNVLNSSQTPNAYKLTNLTRQLINLQI